MLIIAEWRVPETRRDLRRFLFGKIGRHVGQPPAFSHVIYFSCVCFYFHFFLSRKSLQCAAQCLSAISSQMEKPAGWWAGRSSGCCIMLERSIIMSMVRCNLSVDHRCQTSLPSGHKTKPKCQSNKNRARIMYLEVVQWCAFTKFA